MNEPWLNDSFAANGNSIKDNFSNWFGSSQACSDQGEPLRVFHGTSANVDRFEDNKRGIFFAELPGAASAYALGDSDDGENFDEGANVMAVYLSLQNPLHVTRDVLEAFGKTAGLPKFADDFEDSEHYARDLFMAHVLEQNFDGLILESDLLPVESKNGDWDLQRAYVIFSASQIKSATGNSGLYLRESFSLTDMEESLTLKNAIEARIVVEKAVSGSKKPAP